MQVMANIKYCPLCERKVEPVKKWSWGWFILLWLTIAGPLIYVLWYFIFARKKYCPMCGTKRLQNVDKAAEQSILQNK
jgi:RNA polymerase subunit RPABC4/transcription elongation factor Spt4